MPELPEVETVVKWLNKSVKGRRIERAEVLYPRLIRGLAPQAFSRRLTEATIADIGRRGKYILVHLNNDQTLLVHLRMTGEFFYVENDGEIRKQTSVVFYLDNDCKLVFDDQRHFGVMKLAVASKLIDTEELSALGPEPFGDDFTDNYLYEVLRPTARSVKEFLLDQTKIAGLGNIYASEALFAAKLNPTLRGNQVSKSQARRLRTGILDVLHKAVKGGDKAVRRAKESVENYFEGIYDRFQVYGRAGEPCFRCGAIIKRIVQGSRSTFYCPNCQKK